MSLSRPQQIRLKRAQQEAALADSEYRDLIATVSGLADCRSSTDPRLTDAHWDNLLSFFEAIFWQKFDAGIVRLNGKIGATFQRRRYWASKNRCGNTSRDRFIDRSIEGEVSELESKLAGLGCGFSYLRAIQERMRCGGRPFSLVKYAAALRRTLTSKTDPKRLPF